MGEDPSTRLTETEAIQDLYEEFDRWIRGELEDTLHELGLLLQPSSHQELRGMGERLAEAETGVVGGGISDDGASFGRYREKSKPKSDRRCAGVLGSPIRRPSTLAKHIRAAASVSSRRQARDVEGRDQIEVDDAAELVQGMWTLLAQGAQSDSTSRRVADEVQGAELVAGRRKGKLGALEVSDVAGVEAAPELLRDLRPLGPRKVEDRHLCTLPNQHFGRGLRHARGPADHHGGLSRDLHGLPVLPIS